MPKWSGNNWTLLAGPQCDSGPQPPEDDDPETDPEIRARGYKETFVSQYDGIEAYYHKGKYRHTTKQ